VGEEILGLLIGAYLDYHANISHDPAAQQFFEQQAKLLEARLEAAEEQLRQFQVQSGITSLDDQKTALVDRLNQLQLQLDKNSSDLAFNAQEQASVFSNCSIALRSGWPRRRGRFRTPLSRS